MVIIFQCKIIKLNVIIIISSTLVKRMEETNQQVKSGRGFFFFLNCCSVFCFLFLLSKLFVPPAPLDGCICHTKKKRSGRRPLFCLLFFHLVYSRFDLHRRDDDDYLHFILFLKILWHTHTKKNCKISDVLFFVIVKIFLFHFSLSLFPNCYIWTFEYLAEKKLVATVLYIQHFLNNKEEEEEEK